MDELVSIIVPVYNVEKYITETLDCVEAQTCPYWELLLVEDGSGDGTVEKIRDYLEQRKDPRIRVIHQPSNGGAARARNRGLQEAKGRYIAYLDADDLWMPEKLERELAFLKEKNAAFAFTGYEFADENGRGTGKVVHVPETLSYRQALSNTTIFTTTVMFDTEKIDRKLLEMAKVFSMTPWRRIRYIYIPALVPYLKSGCQIALGMSWKSGVAAEVIGVPDHSVGEKLYMAKIYLNTADVLAWTFVIILVSALFEWAALRLLSCLAPG